MRRWLATMECRLLWSAGLGAGWSLRCSCWWLKVLAWVAIIHAVTRRSCAGHVSIGASQGVPLWHLRVSAGDITCELYCMAAAKLKFWVFVSVDSWAAQHTTICIIEEPLSRQLSYHQITSRVKPPCIEFKLPCRQFRSPNKQFIYMNRRWYVHASHKNACFTEGAANFFPYLTYIFQVHRRLKPTAEINQFALSDSVKAALHQELAENRKFLDSK